MLHKAFIIIQELAKSCDGSSINNLSMRTGIPRSTIHRILNALIKEEIVRLVPQKGYILTPKLFGIGLMGLGKKELLDVAIPVLREMSTIIKETISIYILSGMERMCIYCVEGTLPILQKVKIGDKGPLLIGAAGKVLAAGLDENELNSVIEYYLLKDYITREQIPWVYSELDKVRTERYAVSIEERFPECASIAVPIMGMNGHIQAALNIALPSSRAVSDRISEHLKVLFEATKKISEQLGYVQ